jgi:hypothetical protein
MTLGVRAFFHKFLAQFEKEGKKTKWQDIYHQNRKWTAKMLGTGKSRKKGDHGIIGRIGKKFGYNIDPEWRHIDQVWSYYLPEPKKCEYLPWRNDVIIEHENYIKNLEYTFYKFDEISSPLKVGIFYPGEEYEKECLEKCQQMIIKQVSSYPGEVYLIIFGFLNEEEEKVYWHAYEIDFKGNIVNLQKK